MCLKSISALADDVSGVKKGSGLRTENQETRAGTWSDSRAHFLVTESASGDDVAFLSPFFILFEE